MDFPRSWQGRALIYVYFAVAAVLIAMAIVTVAPPRNLLVMMFIASPSVVLGAIRHPRLVPVVAIWTAIGWLGAIASGVVHAWVPLWLLSHQWAREQVTLITWVIRATHLLALIAWILGCYPAWRLSPAWWAWRDRALVTDNDPDERHKTPP